ncbi:MULTISPECIES: GtrA family protein [unclassified Chelatococcus]|uniref:GtrA family protein n=1 Tax=unclassified Chelatococcus TaxID=2638111 RepID=UPI001BCFEC09|nr:MULTISPECIES: GtrA family protein [unclassified Chelatococcus]CAH1648059.1 putative flippase GtrA [Hyphomicrobiales bacterium]MBS7742081.1 GtrA family protein [Chelatococcus sp. HY11]MBX3541121.1 GtrA family protein [Chelatococcus sp.]MCO5074984.1 GtrA family protein [Chelatococcus sp.]CAH1690283.1 putative flippase GtrA [Hyphomicrobiales bacterium]
MLTRESATKVAAFLVAGGIGFLVDAGLLWMGLNRWELSALSARAISFTAAMLTTWVLNRSLAFARQRDRARGQGVELALYGLATLFSGAINIGLYLVVIAMLGREGVFPFIALAAGVGAGLVSNFLLYNHVVFRNAAKRS